MDGTAHTGFRDRHKPLEKLINTGNCSPEIIEISRTGTDSAALMISRLRGLMNT